MRHHSTVLRLCATAVTAVALLAIPGTAAAAEPFDSPPDIGIFEPNDTPVDDLGDQPPFPSDDQSLFPSDDQPLLPSDDQPLFPSDDDPPLFPEPGTEVALRTDPEGCVGVHNDVIPYPLLCTGTSPTDNFDTAKFRARDRLTEWENFYQVNCRSDLADEGFSSVRDNGVQFDIFTTCSPREKQDSCPFPRFDDTVQELVCAPEEEGVPPVLA